MAVVAIDQQKFVKAEVIAARYGISKITVLRYAKSGKIPGKRFQNGAVRALWMFDPAAVDAALDNGYGKAERVG